jgi:hypothetical protein
MTEAFPGKKAAPDLEGMGVAVLLVALNQAARRADDGG